MSTYKNYKEYKEKLENASKFRKGFILLNKNLHKYTRVSTEFGTNNINLYNYWLDVEISYTPNEWKYFEKNIPNLQELGYRKFRPRA